MVRPPLFQVYKFTKKTLALSADFVAANQKHDRQLLNLLDVRRSFTNSVRYVAIDF